MDDKIYPFSLSTFFSLALSLSVSLSVLQFALFSHQLCLLFFSIGPPLGLLPVLGPLEWYMTPTLDSALLISSRAVISMNMQPSSLHAHIAHIYRHNTAGPLWYHINMPQAGFNPPITRMYSLTE